MSLMPGLLMCGLLNVMPVPGDARASWMPVPRWMPVPGDIRAW